MEIAKVTVSGTEARAVTMKPITKGTIGAVVRLEYTGPLWEGLTKHVVFEALGEPVGLLNQGDVVEVPAEVLEEANVPVRVGVYGVNADGSLAVPTIWAYLGTVKGAPGGDFSKPGVPTPTIWAQLQNQIGDLRQLETEAKGNLVEAVNEAAKTGNGESVYVLAEGETIEDAPEDADIVIDPLAEAEEAEPGGYYMPSVTQMDTSTATFSFAASKEGMEAVLPVSVTLPAGPRGEKGDTGATGARGIQGPQGEPGPAGPDGYTPVRGVDYWTDADKNEIKAYVDEAILGGAW